jgi:hypothetical protein
VNALSRIRTLVLLVPAAVLCLVAVGCGSEATSLCNAQCKCEGCSSVELEGCIDQGKTVYQQADEAGCSSELDAFMSCLKGALVCTNAVATEEGCATERSKYLSCLGPAGNPSWEGVTQVPSSPNG